MNAAKTGCTVFLLLLLWLPEAWAQTSAEKERVHAYLKSLDIEDLIEVETRLDEAFDVFDGLIKARRVKVATGEEQSIAKAPAVTSVITAQDIEAMGARSLDEVLQSVPGLQVWYTFSNVSVYGIRGATANENRELLILVNGIRLNDAYASSKGVDSWSGFPVSAIARIEIIRGPGSAVYGADAFAGVIDIITKTAQDIDGSEVGIRLGSDNTRDAWILYGGEYNGFDIAFMADFGTTDGHRRRVESDAQTVWDEVFDTDASLAPGPYASDLTTYDMRLDLAKQHWRFRAGIHQGKDKGAGVGIAQALDPSEPQAEEKINADLSYHNPVFSDDWAVEAQLSYLHTAFEIEYQIFPPGAFGGAYPIGYLGSPAAFEHHVHLDFSSIYHGVKNHLIRIGSGYANYDMYKTSDVRNFGINPFTGEDISPTELVDVSDTYANFVREASKDNWYAFVQDSWTIDPHWELTTGIRYDEYSDFGNTVNPRLGLVWELRPGLVAKLLYGEAFRAPSFQEQYNQNNPIAIGNPDLGPEQIATWETAFYYRASDTLHLALNLFRYEIEDKLDTVPIEPSKFMYANTAGWKGRGGEFELRWKTGLKSSLLLNYSYQNSEDDTGATVATVPYGARQAVYVRGDYLLGANWYFDVQLNWNDEWARAANDPRAALDGYTTLDLIVRRKDIRAGKTNFAFGVRNVFDADVRYPSPGPSVDSDVVNVPGDLPGAGRFYFAEFRYKFQ